MWLKRVRNYATAKQVAQGVSRYNHVRIGAGQVLHRPHFTLQISGRRAGWIGCLRRRSGVFEVAHLSVLPKYRRHGLAEAAVWRVLRMIRSSGGHYAYARIKRYNRPSMSLFRKLGFRKTKGGRVYRFGRRV